MSFHSCQAYSKKMCTVYQNNFRTSLTMFRCKKEYKNIAFSGKISKKQPWWREIMSVQGGYARKKLPQQSELQHGGEQTNLTTMGEYACQNLTT